MSYKTILSLDPSGAYEEGKGTTGYSIWKFNPDNNAFNMEYAGNIRAYNYDSQMSYFDAHIKLLDEVKPDILIMEDYLLYAHKASQQIGSKMETPQLIGLIKYECNNRHIEVVIQAAYEVKRRWTDKILVYKGIIRKTGNVYRDTNSKVVSRHSKDSIRHAMHYITKRSKYGNR